MSDSKPWPWILGLVAVVVVSLTFFEDDTKPASTIPGNLNGRNAAVVDSQLRDLGFANILYSSEQGNSATARSQWTVVSVDGAGNTVGLDAWITVRVR
jgi:hypothetical protein